MNTTKGVNDIYSEMYINEENENETTLDDVVDFLKEHNATIDDIDYIIEKLGMTFDIGKKIIASLNEEYRIEEENFGDKYFYCYSYREKPAKTEFTTGYVLDFFQRDVPQLFDTAEEALSCRKHGADTNRLDCVARIKVDIINPEDIESLDK
ncbi:MAG: hypothetical protein M0R03_22630 [Novosphingobium sp.]|nr:hypothetical protein [Novosphingobium sp.]